MNFPSLPTFFFFFFFFFFFSMQFLQVLVASGVTRLHIQRRLIDDSGFININCGMATGTYSINGLVYTSDEKYISSGSNFEISPTYALTHPQDLFTVLRSFPEGLRNCYTLSPLTPNTQYLVRTRFMYGNYDARNFIPGFDMYIGVNFWFTVTLEGPLQRQHEDIIHVATTNSIDVCLVNAGHGTPFISVLELRPLRNSSYPASPRLSLMLEVREDVGYSPPGHYYYNVDDDTYRRLWAKSPVWQTEYEVVTAKETLELASEANPFKIPTSVLSTACEGRNNRSNIDLVYPPTNDTTTGYYAFWYFVELESLASNDTREFNIFLPLGPGYKLGPIAPKYLQLTTIASPRISPNGSSTPFEFSITKTDESNLYPILNAYEVYRILELPILPTNQEDVDAIASLKDNYKIPRIWQGDPCLPKNYQWDGLNCTYDAKNNPPTITSLSLSLSNLSGELPPSLVKLTSLKYLNLSNNGFTGKIPEFLAHMPTLNVIDLSGNNLSGPVPQGLAEKASNKSIDLRLQGNPFVCNSYPPCEKKLEANKKRRHFIILMVLSVSLLSLLVITAGIIFLAFKVTKKQEGFVSQSIKSRNKQFKYSDIVRITDNLRKVLGRGGFGTVYYGVLQDGTQVAVKVLNNTSSTITLKQFCAEAELLTRVHHVNLVSLIGYCDEHANLALVYEFMSCGNLQMHLSERNEHPLSWKTRLQVSVDVAQGLEYLHSSCKPPIIHRDIKPANILLDEMGHAKIADFGLSRFFDTNNQGGAVSTDFAGTRGYLDPECCKLITSWSEKSDVYAFGIVLLQLLTGKPALIKNTDDEDAVVHIDNWMLPMVESGDVMAIVDKRLQGDLDVNSAWKFLEIAMECVKPTVDQRPRMSEVVADLKLCYASEEKKNASFEGDDGVYYNSNEVFDSGIVTSPSAR